ncbi:MAG: DUF934 domain-containing protein [Congregibacter sp.]|nr:DUF934 domain-containing protein [Congregibacter sp.]
MEKREESPGQPAAMSLTSLTLQEWIEAGEPRTVTVELAGEDDLAAHYAALLPLARINIRFAGFMDGRGFSHAAKLRQLGFQGELIAGGDVIADQWVYLQRCGFDALEGDDKARSASTLPGFSERYQADAREPEPLFRRKRST